MSCLDPTQAFTSTPQKLIRSVTSPNITRPQQARPGSRLPSKVPKASNNTTWKSRRGSHRLTNHFTFTSAHLFEFFHQHIRQSRTERNRLRPSQQPRLLRIHVTELHRVKAGRTSCSCPLDIDAAFSECCAEAQYHS